jgi:hypothetical protein
VINLSKKGKIAGKQAVFSQASRDFAGKSWKI